MLKLFVLLSEQKTDRFPKDYSCRPDKPDVRSIHCDSPEILSSRGHSYSTFKYVLCAEAYGIILMRGYECWLINFLLILLRGSLDMEERSSGSLPARIPNFHARCGNEYISVFHWVEYLPDCLNMTVYYINISMLLTGISGLSPWNGVVTYDACVRLCLNSWDKGCKEASFFLNNECAVLRDAFRWVHLLSYLYCVRVSFLKWSGEVSRLNEYH